jgi:hypothetical protein
MAVTVGYSCRSVIEVYGSIGSFGSSGVGAYVEAGA